MQKRYLFLLLGCASLAFSGSVMASSECYITAGAAGDYHVVIEPTIIQLPVVYMGATVTTFPPITQSPYEGGWIAITAEATATK